MQITCENGRNVRFSQVRYGGYEMRHTKIILIRTRSLAGQPRQLLIHFRRILLSSFFFELIALIPVTK